MFDFKIVIFNLKKLTEILKGLINESKKFNDFYKLKNEPISKVILLKKNNKEMIKKINNNIQLFGNFVRIVDYIVVQNILTVYF
jgi:hypothetical protein